LTLLTLLTNPPFRPIYYFKTINMDFKAEKLCRTAQILVNENIDTVFPLFGAFEERKWAKGWAPVLVYPATETIEEGTTFRTRANDPRESEYLWRVSKFEPQKHLIQYLVSTENRYWTITVTCSVSGDRQTCAEITYCYIGLNPLGNELNRQSLDAMYRDDLRDWQEEINQYLATL